MLGLLDSHFYQLLIYGIFNNLGNLLKGIQGKNSVAYYWLTNFSLLFHSRISILVDSTTNGKNSYQIRTDKGLFINIGNWGDSHKNWEMLIL